MWIEPVSTAVTAAELLSKVVDSSSTIRKLARRLSYLVKNGKAIVPVFGAGGVGKSTVTKLFAGADPLSITAAYEPSPAQEQKKLKGDIPGMLIAAPGQRSRVDHHWPSLYKKLATGESWGLINVVAYGYHSLELAAYQEHDLYENGMTAAAFAKKYVEEMRKVELELLHKLLNGLSAASPRWLVTLVNKQDLWWHERNAVRKHYEGEYSAEVAEIQKRVGSDHFQHEIVPVSFTMVNLNSGGDALAKVNSGYDLPTYLGYLESMYKTVHALLQGGRKQ